MIAYPNVVQGSSEWRRLRLGKPTASSFDRIITPKTRKLSSQAYSYCNDLLAEMMLGEPLVTIQTSWMQRGSTVEPEARAFYEFERNVEVVQVGFIETDDGRMGCSPDGLVGDDGLIELKVPSPSQHVSYLLSDNGVDDAYYVQLQGQLLVSERSWVEICSYHPGMPPAIVKVTRDEDFIKTLALHLNDFCNLLDARREKLAQRGWLADQREEPEADWLGVSQEDVTELLASRGV